MTAAHAVRNRVLQTIVVVYKSGLSIPGAFAPPLDDGGGSGSAPVKQADSGNPDAPVAGDGSAG